MFDYSNSDSMSHNTLGGNGDGPYGIQNINTFWEHQTFPFNSEIGSVGMGDYASLKRFIPKENMVIPDFAEKKLTVFGDITSTLAIAVTLIYMANLRTLRTLLIKHSSLIMTSTAH